MTKIKLGLSGDIGSFSEQAAVDYSETQTLDTELLHLIDMEGVLSALENKKIDLGIFPVVNVQGGLVKMAFEAMGRHTFNPIDEYYLDVQQCLMAKSGISRKDIQKIASHPQGLAQCRAYLTKHFPNADQVEWIDTAKAAKDLAKGMLEGNTAVIAPARAAEYYGLEVLQTAIQDQAPNHTIFVIANNSTDT